MQSTSQTVKLISSLGGRMNLYLQAILCKGLRGLCSAMVRQLSTALSSHSTSDSDSLLWHSLPCSFLSPNWGAWSWKCSTISWLGSYRSSGNQILLWVLHRQSCAKGLCMMEFAGIICHVMFHINCMLYMYLFLALSPKPENCGAVSNAQWSDHQQLLKAVGPVWFPGGCPNTLLQ